MAQPVRSRDWRSRTNEVRHTREVRAETIPEGLQDLIQAMVADINVLKIKLQKLESRVDPIESGIRAVAAEAAKRVA